MFQLLSLRFDWRVVCRPALAVVVSAVVVLWTGVDVALRDDGRCGVAGMGQGGWKGQLRTLGLLLLPCLFNALPAPLVFGMHRFGLAFAEIIMPWLVLAATLGAFWRVRKAAGVLLAPYLAQVSLAARVNFIIWRLNP